LFHSGHFNVLKQLNNIFKQKEIYIVVALNKSKTSNHSLKKRKKEIILFLKKENFKFKKSHILICKELFASFSLKNKITVFARGIRNNKDLEFESNLKKQYLKLNPKLKSLYFLA